MVAALREASTFIVARCNRPVKVIYPLEILVYMTLKGTQHFLQQGRSVRLNVVMFNSRFNLF